MIISQDFQQKLMEKAIEKINPWNRLTPTDVARIMKWSIPKAQEIFKRKDFPSQLIGKEGVVFEFYFYVWCSEHRENL